MRFLTVSVLMGLLLVGLMGAGFRAHAQENDDPWQEPVNVSQSGAASQPRLVVDSSGDLHVLWREEAVNSFYYAQKENGRWRRPAALELPFGTNRFVENEVTGEATLLALDPGAEFPTLLYDVQLAADSDGRIHAFWVDELNRLFHSSVLASEFDTIENWSPRQMLSNSVLGYSVAVDEEDKVHLSYVDNEDVPDMPAGIYYRSRAADSDEWTAPAILYLSAYFRAATPESTNLSITTGNTPGDGSGVYVVMDNRALEEVLFVRSSDGGDTWQDLSIIDRRRAEDVVSSVGPSEIEIVSTGDELQLSWLAGHDTICQQYHQWSEDDGRTWQPPIVLKDGGEVCPTDYRLMSSEDDLLFLLTRTLEGAFLRAWNGEEWSGKERQTILAGFEDPVTHRRVNLDCQQITVGSDNSLFVVGCGSSEGNQDIWLLERQLGEEQDWYSPEPATWSGPRSLMAAEGHLSEPLILSGEDNLLHAFWIIEETEGADDGFSKIFYSSWNEDGWSRQIPLLQLEGRVEQLSGVYDRDNGPFMMWLDKETNSYLSSFVVSEHILLPAEWSDPQPMFDSAELIAHPTPYLDSTGMINVVYAIPLNEGRGIYLVRTADHGKTWSDPIAVVDGVAANWAMVDRPSIARTENGDLHAVFTVYSLEPEPAAQELYYTRSMNDGENWSEVELIAEGDIGWSQIVGIDAQTVLIAWQQQEGNESQLWSQQSMDGGLSWERPMFILEPSSAPGVFSLTSQLHGQPYLVKVKEGSGGGLTLEERRWLEDAWRIVENHDLEHGLKDEHLRDISSAVADDGHLVTIFSTEAAVQNVQSNENGFTVVRQLGSQQVAGPLLASNEPASELLYTLRAVEVPEDTISAAPSEESTERELVSSSASSQSAAEEPTTDLAPEQDTDSGGFDVGTFGSKGESTSTASGIARGILPAVLIIIVVIAVGIFRLRPKH